MTPGPERRRAPPRHPQAPASRTPENRRDRGPCRPGSGVEADVPRGVANGTRLVLRSATSTVGPKGGRKAIRTIPAITSLRAPISLTCSRRCSGDIDRRHLGTGGGDTPEVKRVQTGLLGADYEIANGRYRFARVYNGENWNPQLRAPLTQPGVNVRAGEYLLAVNGREVRAAGQIYSLLRRTCREVRGAEGRAGPRWIGRARGDCGSGCR